MKSYRATLITAVIYSVIIAAIYVVLAVLSLLVRNCSIDMNSTPMIYLMFLMYFRTHECEQNINWNLLDINSQAIASMPDETQTVHRTFIFTLVYLGLYGAMIATALYSLFGIKNSCMGSKSFIIFYVPWILVCTGVIVMDILASTYHIIDMIANFKLDGLIDILEISNPTAVQGELDQLGAITKFLPPFILVLTTAKIFVFFIMDIVVLVLITKAGWFAATYHEFVDENYQRNISQTNVGFSSSSNVASPKPQDNNGIRAAAASTSSPEQSPNDRYDDPSKESIKPAFDYSELFNGETRKDEKVQKFIPRPSTLAVAYSDRATIQDKEGERQIDSRLSHYKKSTAPVAPVAAVTTRRTESPHRDYDKEIDEIFETTINSPVQRPLSLDRPWDGDDIPDKQRHNIKVRVLPPVFDVAKRNSSNLKQRPQVPPKPKPERLNSPNRMPSWLVEEERRSRERSESRSSYQGGARVERTNSSRDELRSQLPWSYFKARDDVPKKAFNELEDDEELPPVPVPDYTLHFGQTKRAQIDDSDGEGGGTFNRYEQQQRY